MRLLDFFKRQFLFYTHTPKRLKIGEIKDGFRITKIEFYANQPLVAPPWVAKVYAVYGVKHSKTAKDTDVGKHKIYDVYEMADIPVVKCQRRPEDGIFVYYPNRKGFLKDFAVTPRGTYL